MFKHGTKLQKNIMRKRQIVTMGYACDIDGACQKVLTATYGKSRCVFKDVLKWNDGDNFVKTAPCATHNKKCQLPSSRASSDAFETSGPNCQMFSRCGKQKGKKESCDNIQGFCLHLMKGSAEPRRNLIASPNSVHHQIETDQLYHHN